MSADLILDQDKIKVINGSLETVELNTKKVTTNEFNAEKATVNELNTQLVNVRNVRGKLSIRIQDGELEVFSQTGGGKVLEISGNRKKALTILGNVTILGDINNIALNKMERKVTKLEKKVAALEAKLNTLLNK